MRESDALDNNPHVSRSALEAIHSQAYGWALSRCDFDHATAEDLMQQAYVELLSGKARFDNKSSLKTFVFSVVQNLARSRFRRLSSRLRLVKIYQAEAVEATVEASEPRADDSVWRAVRALPARQRERSSGRDGRINRHGSGSLRPRQESAAAALTTLGRRRMMQVDDKTLRDRVNAAWPPSKSDEAVFDEVWWAARERLAVSRRRYQRFAAVAAIVAIAFIGFHARPPAQETYIEVADLLETTYWTAPSDVLLPERQFDIYEDMPALFEATEPAGGTLL
jgi:RNA polymerase sigma factor (sigma-70 family)